MQVQVISRKRFPILASISNIPLEKVLGCVDI